MSSVSSGDFNVQFNDYSALDITGDSHFESPVYDFSVMEEALDNISLQISDLSDFLSSDPELLNVSMAETYESDIDGYKLVVGSDNVYIPFDRVSYLTRLPNGQLFNLSTSTITLYALDNYGNHGHTYRFPSYGTLQRYDYSGGSYYWTSVSSSSDNVITGQLGLRTFEEAGLLIIIFLLFIILFVKRR